MNKPLLSVEDLKVWYKVKSKNRLSNAFAYSKAVDGVTFQVYRGETFGVVGESGCGKSTTGKTIVRLNRPTSGRILFDGQDLFSFSGRDLAKRVQIIFQDPYSSLDPRMTAGECIAEPLRVHGAGSKQEIHDQVVRLLNDVGLREDHYTRFPHEFSGGQRQRIGVARAIALKPDLVVCDEPVSALDVSTQAQILNLMQELQAKYQLTYIFISHNLSVVRHLCDRIAVMYLGHIVELADKEELFAHPRHPYTRALLASIPIPDPEVESMTGALTGDVPSPLNPPSGCCFHTRCPHATDACRKDAPALREVRDRHFVACPLGDHE